MFKSNISISTGLCALKTLKKIIIQKSVKSLKHSYNYTNLYNIKDAFGRMLFCAYEIIECSHCGGCNRYRPFSIEIFDLKDSKMLSFSRKIRWNWCFCVCLLQKLYVFHSSKLKIGMGNQQFVIAKTGLYIFNEEDNPVYYIRGPKCLMECCKGIRRFKILALWCEQIGYIIKNWVVCYVNSRVK